MQEDGMASLWVGTARSSEVLEWAMKVAFSEDGDFLGSPFSRAFAVDYYEEGLREAAFFDEIQRDIGEALRGVSYEDQITEGFRSLRVPTGEFNSVVLLFDYRHEGASEWSEDGISLRFIAGCECERAVSHRT